MVENVVIEEGVVESQEVSEEATEELDYDAAFDQQWGEAKDEPVVEEPKDEEVVSEEEAAEVSPEPDDAGGAVKEDENQGQEPAAATDNDDPYSWINSLPDEVKEQAEALKHRAQSDQGRVAAYNRRVNDLQAEVDRMKPRQPQTAEQARSPAPAASELPEEFKKLKEDFPEFADAVEAIRAHDREQFRAELSEKLQPLEAERTTARRSNFKQAVTTAAEDIFDTQNTGVVWEDVVQGEDFRAWLSMQPKSVQHAATIPDAEEAIYVLRSYERDYQAELARTAPAKAQPVQQEAPAPTADKVQARRQKRQERSVGVKSRPIISDPNSEGGDYEAEFNRRWGG